MPSFRIGPAGFYLTTETQRRETQRSRRFLSDLCELAASVVHRRRIL